MKAHYAMATASKILGRISQALIVLLLAGCSSMLASLDPVADISGKDNAQTAETTVLNARAVRKDFDAAMKLIKAGKYDKGVELLNKVTARSKNNSPPFINLAMAYHRTGNLQLAESNLQEALRIDPENPVANHEYALLYRKTGRFNEARDLYEKTLTKYPGFHLAHRNLGILCDLYLRDYGCALQHYQAYSSAMPDDKAVKIWITDIQKRTQENTWQNSAISDTGS